jgi:hypothetical protein
MAMKKEREVAVQWQRRRRYGRADDEHVRVTRAVAVARGLQREGVLLLVK